MPITVDALFNDVGINIDGIATWEREKLPVSNSAGVYVISLSSDSSSNDPTLPEAPIAQDLVRGWIGRVSTFAFKDELRPSAEAVAKFLNGFWIPDECILYIGKATCLRERLRQFFNHKLGDRKPHAGGHWLKTLLSIEQLSIYYSECSSPKIAGENEQRLLHAFSQQVSEKSKARLHPCKHFIPFANREFPQGIRKQNCIRHDVNRSARTK